MADCDTRGRRATAVAAEPAECRRGAAALPRGRATRRRRRCCCCTAAGPARRRGRTSAATLGALRDRFHVLAVDQLGFGQSSKPTEFAKQFFAASADALAELLDVLGIERAHCVGNSLGGGTSVRLALDHPDKAGRLVLMARAVSASTSSRADPTEGIKKLYAFAAPPGPSPEKLADFLRTLVFDQSMITDELVAERFQYAADPATLASMGAMGTSFMTRRPSRACSGATRTGCGSGCCWCGAARTGSTRSTARSSRSS